MLKIILTHWGDQTSSLRTAKIFGYEGKTKLGFSCIEAMRQGMLSRFWNKRLKTKTTMGFGLHFDMLQNFESITLASTGK